MLGNMLGSYGSSINSATAAPESSEPSEHNKALLRAIDPSALQTVHLPPMPGIIIQLMMIDEQDEANTTGTAPIVCHITTRATNAQANSGANRAITDNPSILHNSRQMETPYPVGSIDADNKLYCTTVGEIHLRTMQGKIEKFQCLYSAQSAGTVISPDNKCTTLPHLTKWEQVGDTRTGTAFIRFRNKQDDVVASLPTYHTNGLWYTQLAAIPADPEETAQIRTMTADQTETAQIRTMTAPPDADELMALTDSDRHYWTTPMHLGGAVPKRQKSGRNCGGR
jgi:hypothetical protein